MTDRIDLVGIEVYAKHGVLPTEQETAQVFKVDVAAYLNLAEPGATGDLSTTLDYGELALAVREVAGSESHPLIERVAQRVADVVLESALVDRTVVTIHKPNAPVDAVFDDISVTIERSR